MRKPKVLTFGSLWAKTNKRPIVPFNVEEYSDIKQPKVDRFKAIAGVKGGIVFQVPPMPLTNTDSRCIGGLESFWPLDDQQAPCCMLRANPLLSGLSPLIPKVQLRPIVESHDKWAWRLVRWTLLVEVREL